MRDGGRGIRAVTVGGYGLASGFVLDTLLFEKYRTFDLHITYDYILTVMHKFTLTSCLWGGYSVQKPFPRLNVFNFQEILCHQNGKHAIH